MSQQSGWHDGYLHAYGDERFTYNPSEPWTYSNNFKTKVRQTRYGSRDSQYPPYVLGPKYFGLGWGMSTNRASGVADNGSTPFCSLSTGQSESMWSVHLDKTSISGYSDVIRIKYYEGPNSFSVNSSLHGLREDWYFARGVGLVRIDVHYFCPNSWGFSKCKPCQEDADCLLNEYIQTPHLTLSRARDYLSVTVTVTPTNTPTPTVTNTPTPTKKPTSTPTPTIRPTATPTLRPTNTPTPTPTRRPTNTPTPTLMPTNTPTPRPTASLCSNVPGDVNNDGKVNVLDIIKIISVYNTRPPGDPCADLNNDGKVNVLDIIKAISYY